MRARSSVGRRDCRFEQTVTNGVDVARIDIPRRVMALRAHVDK